MIMIVTIVIRGGQLANMMILNKRVLIWQPAGHFQPSSNDGRLVNAYSKFWSDKQKDADRHTDKDQGNTQKNDEFAYGDVIIMFIKISCVFGVVCLFTKNY